MVKRLLAVMLAVLLPLVAQAANAELRLDIETFGVGQAIGMSVIVQNGNPRGVPQFESPDALRVTYTGQSTTTSIVNGQVESYVKFRFEIAAQEEGSYTVGPARVQVVDRRGKTYEIETGRAALQVKPGTKGGNTAAVEVTTAFQQSSAWLGEVVLYEYGLRSRREIQGGRWFGHPADGLRPPRDGQRDERKYQVQDAAGRIYVEEVAEPRVVTEVGPLAWDAPALELDLVAAGESRRGVFRLFQRTERYVVTGSDLNLEVRPLPSPPPGYSGLVGDFSLRSGLERDRVRVGDSVRWTVELIGDGTLEGYALPEPGKIDGAQVYDGATSAHATVKRGAYRAVARFERTIVPTREGTVELPPLQVVVFSPDEGRYKTLASKPVQLTVRPGENGEVDLQSFASDPSALVPEVEDNGPRPAWTRGRDTRLPWLEGMPFALALLASPSLVLLGLLAGDSLRSWQAARAASEQPREATPSERLALLPTDTEPRLAELDAILRLALARRGGVSVAELDRDAVLGGLDPDLRDRIVLVTQKLDRARFAGAEIGDPADDVRTLVQLLEQA